MSYFRVITVMAIIIFVGCKPEEMQLPISPNPVDEVQTIIPNGDENYLNGNSEYIFDQSKLHTFELNLPASHLAEIDGDPTKEKYVEGSLTFEGETLSPIGIRYKGSIGAFVGCVSGPDWANPSGFKTCTKLSMKIKINWNDTDDKFYGLKKLQFHSQNLDDSQLRERTAYWLFRQMGVPAPRSVHARLIINGKFSGLYALTEQIDGRFTRYNFEDGSGNLYKEIWPVNSNGHPYSEQTYLNKLKTNEEDNPSAERIRTFGQEIADSDPESIQSVIKKWMDLEEIVSYCAVDRTIRVDDGPFHWYCGGNVCDNHNYYWYEDPSHNSLHLIPWDMDNAFENIISNQNPVTPIADAWGEITADCQPFRYGPFQISQRSAACDKLIAGWASYTDEYNQAVQQFKQGPLSDSQVNARINEWTDQIRAATIEAYESHDDALSTLTWEFEIEKLKSSLEFARNN